MITYEQRLKGNREWALQEGSMHFERDNSVHNTLRKITKRLDELGIPYALVGGMAMFLHGYERFTKDVDILVTREGLEEIHRRLEGLGYVPPFTGSKQLRDAEYGVRVEFLVTGDYPGDGKPKDVAFPHPDEVTTVIDGIRCVRLPKLIELKLASGMTEENRLKDLADVQEMIKELQLPEDLANQLHPFVRDKYRQFWAALHKAPPKP
jgi:hypothetical protein